MTTEEASTCPICLESLFAAVSVSPTTESRSSATVRPSLGPVMWDTTGTWNTTTSATINDDTTNSAITRSTSAIGTTVPCGHCLHVHCWDGWMAASMNKMNHHHHHSSWDGRRPSTKCPMCNSATTAFVRLFLNVPIGAAVEDNDDALDDISIETEEDDNDGDINDYTDTNVENEVVNVDAQSPVDDRKLPFQNAIRNSSTSRSSSSCSSAKEAPPIIDLLCDDDDDDDSATVSSSNHHCEHRHPPMTTATPTMIVTIDDHDGTKEHHRTMKRSSSVNTKATAKQHQKNHNDTASLKKYRRMIRKLQQQRKELQSQYQKYLDQSRTVQSTLNTKQDEYTALFAKYTSLEGAEHNTQLRLEHIMLEKVRLQNQVHALQDQLSEQTTMVQTKDSELHTLQLQHIKQIKDLKNQKHCNMSEIQTILQERPKLLEQIRTMKEQIQQFQEYQARTRSKFGMLSSTSTNSNPDTTITSLSSSVTDHRATQKQRRQLLRTMSEGLDHNNSKRNNAEVDDGIVTSKRSNTSHNNRTIGRSGNSNEIALPPRRIATGGIKMVEHSQAIPSSTPFVFAAPDNRRIMPSYASAISCSSSTTGRHFVDSDIDDIGNISEYREPPQRQSSLSSAPPPSTTLFVRNGHNQLPTTEPKLPTGSVPEQKLQNRPLTVGRRITNFGRGLVDSQKEDGDDDDNAENQDPLQQRQSSFSSATLLRRDRNHYRHDRNDDVKMITVPTMEPKIQTSSVFSKRQKQAQSLHHSAVNPSSTESTTPTIHHLQLPPRKKKQSIISFVKRS